MLAHCQPQCPVRFGESVFVDAITHFMYSGSFATQCDTAAPHTRKYPKKNSRKVIHAPTSALPDGDDIVVKDSDHVATVVRLCNGARWRWWSLNPPQLGVRLYRPDLANVSTSTR